MSLSTSDPVQAEAVIRWLDANPELLEAACRRRSVRLTEVERDRHGHWLHCCLLGGIAAPG